MGLSFSERFLEWYFDNRKLFVRWQKSCDVLTKSRHERHLRESLEAWASDLKEFKGSAKLRAKLEEARNHAVVEYQRGLAKAASELEHRIKKAEGDRDAALAELGRLRAKMPAPPGPREPDPKCKRCFGGGTVPGFGWPGARARCPECVA